jgi:ADP-ribosylglycohydrolase
MPYHAKELKNLVEDITLWADLRLDQDADVKPVLKRLRKELLRARKDLESARPRKKTQRREPDDLEAIRSLRPDGPRKLWRRLRSRGLHTRMKGAWLGRAAGCTLGVPVENWTIDAMEKLARGARMPFPPEDYWTTHPQPDEIRYGTSPTRDYLRGGMKAVPVDDDLTYTLLGLILLESYGPDFTTDQVGEAWLKYLPEACTAEAVALDNLRNGIPAGEAADHHNPYQEWIGADIRSDPWAYAAPGWPEKAAEMAWRDACLSHRGNGIYGAMFFAAAIAAAFAVDDPLDALRIGLTEIPRECRLAQDVQWALDLAPSLGGWREARAAVDARFPAMHPVHTNNNACLTVFGLHLGQKDFTRTIGLTVAMGLDNDCTAATAGSLLGAVIGVHQIPEHWWRPFRNTAHTYLREHPAFRNTDIVRRFIAAARQVWTPAAP